MDRLNHLIAKSAREWYVPVRTACVIFFAPLVVSLLLIPLRLEKSVYKFLLDEDQVFEWATFACFALGGVVGLAIAQSQRRAGNRWAAALYLLFAAMMIFAAGEEISWGQRVVGFETPAELLDINKQEEFTLHNIGETLSLFKAAMMVIGLFGSVAFLANQAVHVEQYWSGADALLVPPLFLATSFFVVFVYRLLRLLIWRKSGFTITAYGESVEFWLSFGLLGFSTLVWRRQRVEQRQRLPARPVQRAGATDG